MENMFAQLEDLSLEEAFANTPSTTVMSTTPRRSSLSASAKDFIPSHPAISNANDGKFLHIDLDFNPLPPGYIGHSLTLPPSHPDFVDMSILNIIEQYRSIAEDVKIDIWYSPSWLEPEQLKRQQCWIIRHLAKLLNTFDRVSSIDIRMSMPRFNWGQAKNAVYFYQLNLQNWKFSTKIGNGDWVKLELGCDLDRRFIGYRRSLEERGHL